MGDLRHLFTPLRVGHVTLKNRIIFGPHGTNLWPNRLASADTVAYYEERAKGGVAMIITGYTSVDEDQQYGMCPALWSDDVIPGLAQIAGALHSHGCVHVVQLSHPGVHQNPDGTKDHLPALAPSVVPGARRPMAIPKEMTLDEIHRIQDLFVNGALRAQQAGADGVELHYAQGDLGGQFLSPFKNRRTDEYGGSTDKRVRFGLEVLRKIRAAVGPDLVVGMKINSRDMVDGGLETDEAVTICKIIDAAGLVDYVNVSQGLYRSVEFMMPSHYSGLGPGYQVPFTAEIKAAIESPVFVVGRIHNPAFADGLIADSKADAVVMVRELIAEPAFAKLAEQGRLVAIRPCVYWNHCLKRVFEGLPLECSINGATGQEVRYGRSTFASAADKKTVLVVGGGPAGMEFARVAAERGHKPVIYELADELGGQVNQLIRLPKRSEIKGWLEWLEAEVRSAGVTVNLRRAVDMGNVRSVVDWEGADVVVVATGARPARDGFSGELANSIPGWEQDGVMTYAEVLGGAIVGEQVLILDEQAERTTPGLAELLAGEGKHVHVLTHWSALSAHMLAATLENTWVYGALDELGVQITPNSSIRRIAGRDVTCFNLMNGREWVEQADTVVLVTMKYSNDELYKALVVAGDIECYRIGDSVTPRWVGDATREGMRLATQL